MKKIYIAKTVRFQPVALILADSKRDAEIAFTAMKIDIGEIEEIDPASESYANSAPVIFLLTSVGANSRDYAHRIGGVDFRIWKRGL